MQGTLFVAGLSECGSEFHLGTLLSLSKKAEYHPVWPQSKRYLHVCKANWQQSLAKTLNDNDFELIIIVNLLFGKKLTQHKRLAETLHTTVAVKGNAFDLLFNRNAALLPYANAVRRLISRSLKPSKTSCSTCESLVEEELCFTVS